MSVVKRGRVYWYDFYFRGKRFQCSSRQGNRRVAQELEAAHKTRLLASKLGVKEQPSAPTFREFIMGRFEPWARATFEHSSPKTWTGWYRTNLRALLAYDRLANRSLDEITSEHAADFAAHRETEKLQPSSINSSLRVLRRALRMAAEWGVISSIPKIKLLRGERHRERVLTAEEEARYLAAAREPLTSISTVMVDTGLGPDECFRLRWEAITWINGRHGTLLVTHGKTAARRRVLPMTSRVRATLDAVWKAAGNPEEGWVFTADTRSGHVESSTVKKQHQRALRESGVRSFVLYSLRHTFLTRLGMSGCDVWTLARIAGHGSIGISARYVHSSEDAVHIAISRLSSSTQIPKSLPS